MLSFRYFFSVLQEVGTTCKKCAFSSNQKEEEKKKKYFNVQLLKDYINLQYTLLALRCKSDCESPIGDLVPQGHCIPL